MKIIIDISEDDFNKAKILFAEGVSNNIEYAVAHGTILPEKNPVLPDESRKAGKNEQFN